MIFFIFFYFYYNKMVRESKGIAGINAANLIVSVGLLALGIVMIIYGFGIPMKKCSQSNGTVKDCLGAADGITTDSKDITDKVHNLRVVALITGFILIIPFGLNVVEYILKMAPGTGGITGALSQIGGTANQASYSMNHAME